MNEQHRRQLIQRLIDNEAQKGETDALLALGNDQPEVYREIALAFIEKQRLDQMLRALPIVEHLRNENQQETKREAAAAADAGNELVSDAERVARRLPFNGHSSASKNRLNGIANQALKPSDDESSRPPVDRSVSVASRKPFSEMKPESRQTTSRTWQRWSVTHQVVSALLALVCLTFGWWLGAQGVDEPERSAGGEQATQQHSAQPSDPPSIDASQSHQANQDGDRASTPSNMQALTASDFAQIEQLSHMPLSPKMQMQLLLERGLLFQREEGLVEMESPAGEPIVMPVRRTRVDYVGDRIYQ